MIAHVLPAEQLGGGETALWSHLHETVPSLSSPFFSPAFTAIVAAARGDVRVAVLEEEGRIVGFFPFQRGRLGLGRPVGSVISDYHGAVIGEEATWDAAALIRACGLGSWDFHHLLASQAPFERYHRTQDGSRQVDLADGFEAYMAVLEATHGPTLTRLERKVRKLERDHGALRFVPHTAESSALRALLDWKATQYTRTGTVDLTRQRWICEVLERAHASQTDAFAGILSSLYAGERLVAAHLGIRAGAVCHSWFQVYDPQFASYSPGLVLLLRLSEWAPAAGIRTIDLGRGDYRFKNMLTNRSVMLAEGAVAVPSLAAVATRSRRAARSLVRRTAVAPRVRRIARALPRPRMASAIGGEGDARN